jgi:hypothetical protein
LTDTTNDEIARLSNDDMVNRIASPIVRTACRPVVARLRFGIWNVVLWYEYFLLRLSEIMRLYSSFLDKIQWMAKYLLLDSIFSFQSTFFYSLRHPVVYAVRRMNA